jgi:hypothetical protein
VNINIKNWGNDNQNSSFSVATNEKINCLRYSDNSSNHLFLSVSSLGYYIIQMKDRI